MAALDKDLGRTDAGVVVRAEAHAVRTGVEQSDEIACAKLFNLAVAREEVAALADRTHDVDDLLRSVLADNGNDLVMRAVERWPNEVVHRGVGDDEALRTVLLGVENTREQCTGLRDEEATGLEQEMNAQAMECTADGACIIGDALGGIEVGTAVLDAEAATGVEILNIDAIGAEVFDERPHALHRFRERLGVANLRADVNTDSSGLDACELCGAAIELTRGVHRDAKLVLAQPRGDVRVRLREDVWVYAQ